MSTILVTGGAGFIGSHTVEALLKLGKTVVVVDNMNDAYDTRQKWDNIQLLQDVCQRQAASVLHFHHVDICDMAAIDALMKQYRPDIICHLAARAGVRPSIQDPGIYIHANVQCTLVMLQLAVTHRVQNFVYASSSSVYGNIQPADADGFREDQVTDRPVSPYAATKKATELLAHTYHALYGLPCSGLRFFTVYGPRGRPDMAPFQFTDRIYHGLPIYQYGDGTSQRDYTFIDDIVEGILLAMFSPRPFEIYNLGRGQPVLLEQLIACIERGFGKQAKRVIADKQLGDVDFTLANITKAKNLLGYCPRVTLEQGMKAFMSWYLASQYKNERAALDDPRGR
ncbi:hypothetical protein BDZ91DRAFT_718533 [Kalaharituber pfeilii]|nr:hypothetical protein BDZ91DRAFT_718533 [Kalaharituber pfeilii]